MIGVFVRGVVAVVALVAVGVGLFYAGRCTGDPHNPDQPAATADTADVRRAVGAEGPRGRVSLVEGEASATSRGRSAPLRPDAPERRQTVRYAADALAALDSVPLPDDPELAGDLPPDGAGGVLPAVRVARYGDTGALSVVDSRGAWVREEQRCPEGRRWEAGTTADGAGFYGNCARAVPALLPAVAKSAALCVGIGGLAAGLAAAADAVNDDDGPPVVTPLEAGIGGAALCGGIVLVRAVL